MFSIFPDRINKKNPVILKPPLTVICENPSLTNCGKYIISLCKKNGFSGIKLDSLKNAKDTIFLEVDQKSSGDAFSVETIEDNWKTSLIIRATNTACFYYAIDRLFQDITFRRNHLITEIKSIRGKSHNPERNLIIMLSWMEMMFAFPHFSLSQWKDFVDLVSMLRFTRIDFMQWGCTNYEPPASVSRSQNEWESWEKAEKRGNHWPIPAAYEGLKYQQRAWQSLHLFQPWLFPISKRSIRYSEEFSVCLPPVQSIPLAKWKKGKLEYGFWQPPFIKNPKIFQKIVDCIHERGMKTGIFTTARIPCVKRERLFKNYWSDIIDFFLSQEIDDFVFETEEGPESFQHHKNCTFCKDAYGDIFTGYTKKVAAQTQVLTDIIMKKNSHSSTGWVLHVPLSGGFGNPAERKEWLKNPDNYVENLRLFEKLAHKKFYLNYVSRPGDHGISHNFLPQIYFEVFGQNRIHETGYTHAWGPCRAFYGMEAYFIASAKKLWGFHPEKQQGTWNEGLNKKILSLLSEKLYGSKDVLKDFAGCSINNRRVLQSEKSLVSPFVWDRGIFCIKDNVLKKMLKEVKKEKKDFYLAYPVETYKMNMKVLEKTIKKLEKIKFNPFPLPCSWNFHEGFEQRLALVKAAYFAFKYLIAYNRILVDVSMGRKIDIKRIRVLVELGKKINDHAERGHRNSWWPSTSRLGGLYDYFAFAIWLMENPDQLKPS